MTKGMKSPFFFFFFWGGGFALISFFFFFFFLCVAFIFYFFKSQHCEFILFIIWLRVFGSWNS